MAHRLPRRLQAVTLVLAGQYTLYLDYTVNGTKSSFVSVNDGTPIEASVTGIGNATVQTVTVPVNLQSGASTIRIFNPEDSAPALDRISIG